MQRFNRGDWVKVADDLGPSMRHFTAGCEAIVIGSYADQYGGNDHGSYTLHLKGEGQCSWYYGTQLTLLEAGREDKLAEWEAEATLKGDLGGEAMKNATERKRGAAVGCTDGLGTFVEQYEVSLDYKKPDGYWVCSHREHVSVPVKHGVNEKNNHAAAEAIAKQRYPKCKINSVTYC